MSSDAHSAIEHIDSRREWIEPILNVANMYLDDLETFDDPVLHAAMLVDKMKMALIALNAGLKHELKASLRRDINDLNKEKLKHKDDKEAVLLLDKHIEETQVESKENSKKADATIQRINACMRKLSEWIQHPSYELSRPRGQVLQAEAKREFTGTVVKTST
jgi:hypothetical protein